MEPSGRWREDEVSSTRELGDDGYHEVHGSDERPGDLIQPPEGGSPGRSHETT